MGKERKYELRILVLNKINVIDLYEILMYNIIFEIYNSENK